ncbi:MAG: PAS domain-containing protein, partial [Clostridia bacterium]|nr:PAS domain-containing protein [Clostridia bacterium]
MRLDDAARAVFNAMTEGVLIIDTEGKIVFGNDAYRRFLLSESCGSHDIEGRLLRELRPGARLPEVLETRRPILHAPRQEVDDIYFVNMYPVFENGVLTGGISVVTFIRDAYDFRAELEEYEKHSCQVLRRINKANSAHYTFDSIVASTPEALAIKSLAQKIAATDATVLLESESGTGKELYAQAVHNASPRSDSVFVAINCANFNPSILESELFGYVEGAFTGAKKGGKLGLFEAASGGTLFLDEISEMDLGLQAKLLRALQERRVRPVGGVEEIEVDVRI